MARKAGGGQSIIITGVPEIDRKLRTLEPRLQKKVVRQAMRAGMKLVESAARALAPRDSGQLAAGIKTRAARARRGTITIEVRVGEGDFKGETFYGGFQEYGTKHQPAHAFMKPAFETKGEAARDATLSELLAGILREAQS